MFRKALVPLIFLGFAAAAAAQYPAQPSGLQQVADLPPGTVIAVHQRGNRFPIQCTLAWVNPKSLACDTPATTAPPQRLIFPATSIESIQPLTAVVQSLPPTPEPAYVQPQPQTIYTPAPPQYPRNYGASPSYIHHSTGVIVLCAAAGGLLGGLIGKNWSTQAGFIGAAFGGLTGGAIGFAATDAYDRPHYAIRIPLP